MCNKFDNDFCGFCGKSKDDVNVLVTGPIVNVCNECVDLLVDILIQPNEEQTEDSNPFGGL
jgi:ATP-dependent Clp protease ATP-binding subunit ClpX